MAAELAAGYVSLTVKLAKGGMADVTKEVKKEGKKGGEVYSEEFGKQVEKDVGKKLPDTIGKATKSGGGIGKAAKEAAIEFGKGMLDGIQDALGAGGGGSIADQIGKATKSGGGIGKAAQGAAEEFGKGFRDGVKDALKTGDIEGALAPINEKVKTTTDLIKGIGSATGMDTSGIDSLSGKITTVLSGIETTAESAHTSFSDLNTVIDDLGKKGEGSKLDVVAGKVGLITDAINTLNDIKGQTEDADAWGEEHIPFMKWLNKYTPDKLGQMARERSDAVFDNLQRQIAGTPGGPVGRFGLPSGTIPVPIGPLPNTPSGGRPGGRAGGGSIHGPGGPKADRIPIMASSGEHMLTARDVAAMGGQSGVYAFRNALHMQGGGEMDYLWRQLARFGGYKGGTQRGFTPFGGNIAPSGTPGGGFHPSMKIDTSTISYQTPAEWLAAQRTGLVNRDVIRALTGGGTRLSKSAAMGGMHIPMYAGGGAVDEAIAFAASISGKPYVYGGVGPGGFDCSGAQSAIYAILTGKSSGTRHFNTESDFRALGFLPGYMPGAYNIGIKRGGGGRLSHMGATLPNGVTFESGGNNNGVMYGDGARGANTFPLQFYLPVGGGDPRTGGTGGGAGTAGGGTGGGGTGGGTGGGGTGGGGLSSNPMRALQQLGEQQNALDTQKAEQVKKLLPDFGQLADIGMAGVKETFLPPGFSDPQQWKSTKSIGALLGWIGGLTGDPAAASIMGGIGAGITGSGSGLYSGIMGAIPQPFGNLAPNAGQFGAGGSQIPAGPMPPGLFGTAGVSIGTYNDNSGNSAYAGAKKESDAHNLPQKTDLTRISR